MKRTWALVGAAALAVAGAATAAQAQAPGSDAAQRRYGVQMEQGAGPRGPQQQGRGAMRGRGPGGPGSQAAGPMRPGGRGPRGGGPGFGLRGLDLTEEQEAQVKAIHEQTRQAIDNLLSPEQKAKRRGGR